jgi:predicted alpha/beta hydrolase
MPYQEPLAHSLATTGLRPWWFAFSGQEGTAGSYSRNSGVDDITVAVDYLAAERPDDPLFVISHCAGGLMALEYLRARHQNAARIEKLVIYGLLFNPARRRRHSLPQFKQRGVSIGLTDEDWAYNPLPVLASLDIPVLFCHAKDKINRRRATEQELAKAAEVTPKAEVVWFEKGYDRDLETLPEFVERYTAWLNRRVLVPNEEAIHAEMGT